MNAKTITIILAALVLVIGVVIFIQQGTQNPGLEGGNGDQTEDTEDTEENSLTPDKTVTVQGTDFSFDPVDITAERGSLVRFNFENAGDTAHNLKVRSSAGEIIGGSATIGPGGSDSFTIRVPEDPEVVELTTVCTVPGHEEQGMIGTITVQ